MTRLFLFVLAVALLACLIGAHAPSPTVESICGAVGGFALFVALIIGASIAPEDR